MAREVITTSLLVIASIIATIALINAVFPSLAQMASSFTSLANNLNERVETNVDIIFVIASSSTDTVNIWIKNIGSNKIPNTLIEKSDLFIYSSSMYLHVPYNDSSPPTWTYSFENGDGDDYWENGETINITVQLSSLPAGEYTANFILYNGVSTKDTFSV
ncbi:hypothetical protein Asulf_00846 [Archaeoglobus sulfaticallidus PM70-1]|uniref:Archaeal flagellar protein G n=1 Tax=Archaeoglobus sulfaticallidus PM70-1 TaxID=387631 RepID=N0BB69_9EURY|nr:hypothetical protein [Archaeoglobus sulfaticallidus]AGK60854.1 hypothetical protein Asulf_00846 [Archaeoglobus sulfaticallidus PM70-1]